MLGPNNKYKSYAPIPLRIIFLLYLISAIKARVYKPEILDAFAKQLDGLSFPVPQFFAYLGTFSLLMAYVMTIIGWKTKWAAIPMIIYFAIAILTYHLPEGHSIRSTMPALVLLAMSIFLLLNGAGKPSIDEGW